MDSGLENRFRISVKHMKNYGRSWLRLLNRSIPEVSSCREIVIG
jgi:hypothetical protein